MKTAPNLSEVAPGRALPSGIPTFPDRPQSTRSTGEPGTPIDRRIKALIVEDDLTSRILLQQLLKTFGPSHLAADGEEAVEAVRSALESRDPYQLICLDIMMPRMDGQEALRIIRDLEARWHLPYAQRARIVMTTALGDMRNVMEAYSELCDGYLVKPIEAARLRQLLATLWLG